MNTEQAVSSASARAGGDPRHRLRHTLVHPGALARHFDSTGLAG